MDTIKNLVSKNVNPIIELGPQDIFKKMLDNIIWVIVLVVVLFFLIMAYLSTQTFYTKNKINNLQKEFKGKNNLQSVEKKSVSGQEEEFDEIDIDKHKLVDIQIASSTKSYLIGRQMLDYGSADMVIQTLKMGTKFIELDLFLNNRREVVVANGLKSGNWKLTFNSILFTDICNKLGRNLFNVDFMTNAGDPMILFLNINVKKEYMESIYLTMIENFKSFLLDSKYSISGTQDVLQAPIRELMGKLIIISSGSIGNTSLDKIVHLRLGDRVKKMYFKELIKQNKDEMIQFNKYHLTIVVPPIGFRSINYNPEQAQDYGCQIVAMHYQSVDDFLRNYLSHFSEKSFRLKPFEHTRFHDIPQKGYDESKIAYYDTHNGDLTKRNTQKNPQDIDADFEIEYSGYGLQFSKMEVSIPSEEPLFTEPSPEPCPGPSPDCGEIYTFEGSIGDDSTQCPSPCPCPDFLSGEIKFEIKPPLKYKPIKSYLKINDEYVEVTEKIDTEISYITLTDRLCDKTNTFYYLSASPTKYIINDIKKDGTIGLENEYNINDKDIIQIKEKNGISRDYIIEKQEDGTLKLKNIDGSISLPPIDYEVKKKKFCCQTNINDDIYDLEKLKKIQCDNLEQHTFSNNECKNDTSEKIFEAYNYGFNAIRIKLQKLNIAEHLDISDIERLAETDSVSLETYKDKHIFIQTTKNLIKNKFDLIFFILSKQLKKGLNKERKRLFTTDYEDKCVRLDEIQCTEEPICYVDRSEKKTNCVPDTDRVPFSQYCLPRYIVPNRNLCYDNSVEITSPADDTYSTINNESLRSQFHQTMTGTSFYGRWSSLGGIIEIPDSFNPYCEFKFKTENDNKEYTMYIVKKDGTNIPLTEIENIDINTLRAKGTFVDNNLRELEERYNLPRLENHGYADMKMGSNATDLPDLDKCYIASAPAEQNVNMFHGVYQYSNEVVNGKNEKIYSKIKTNYLFNTEKTTPNTDDKKHYCYQMIDIGCNRQVQDMFGRLPKTGFDPTGDYDVFSKADLPPIESFSSNEGLLESFRGKSPYDPDYINQFTYTGELSLEYDPEEMGEPPYPSLDSILIDMPPSISNSLSLTDNKVISNKKDFLFPSESLKNNKGKEVIPTVTDDIEIQNYIEENDSFYKRCYQEGSKYLYRFNYNSTLLGTMYEDLFKKKCEDYFKNKEKQSLQNLQELNKLNLKSYDQTKLENHITNLGYGLKNSDLDNLKDIVLEKTTDVLQKMIGYITKVSKEDEDGKDMYQTKKSAKGENRVDTIQSDKDLPLCLKRYKGDEERCFSSGRKEYATHCPISECYNPKLVTGACNLNTDDMDPYYFEHNAHFVIKSHPKNSNRRIIYLDYAEEPRKCERNKAYFNSYIEIIKLKKEIEVAQRNLGIYMAKEIVLTPEQKTEYKNLLLEKKEIEASQGVYTAAPGEVNKDFHSQAEEQGSSLMKITKKINEYKPNEQQREIARIRNVIKEMENKLKSLESGSQKKTKSGEYYEVSKKMCLKYGYERTKMGRRALVANLMYEDDRRNLKKGYKSDWLIEKKFNDKGEHTGQYKIRAEMAGTKFNLSRKPKPKIGVSSIFRFPLPQPKPKPEDQLWYIKEVGDLNEPRNIGETSIEGDIKSSKKKTYDNIIEKVVYEDVAKVIAFIEKMSKPPPPS